MMIEKDILFYLSKLPSRIRDFIGIACFSVPVVTSYIPGLDLVYERHNWQKTIIHADSLYLNCYVFHISFTLYYREMGVRVHNSK